MFITNSCLWIWPVGMKCGLNTENFKYGAFSHRTVVRSVLRCFFSVKPAIPNDSNVEVTPLSKKRSNVNIWSSRWRRCKIRFSNWVKTMKASSDVRYYQWPATSDRCGVRSIFSRRRRRSRLFQSRKGKLFPRKRNRKSPQAARPWTNADFDARPSKCQTIGNEQQNSRTSTAEFWQGGNRHLDHCLTAYTVVRLFQGEIKATTPFRPASAAHKR